MADAILQIRYTFQTEDGGWIVFPVQLDAHSLRLRTAPPADPPAWTQLEHHQCPGCPLRADAHPHCPAAIALTDIVDAFGAMLSYGRIQASVELYDRTVRKETTIQRALSSLLGLYMATSGCPNMDFLRPLARFHQPFATREETVFRATSAYLLRQYFQQLKGQAPDLALEGLKRAYEQVQWVNFGMARRLRSVVQGDANVNAIILLDLLAKDLPQAIEENLHEIAHLFDLPEPGPELAPAE